MPQHKEKRILPYRPDQLFDLVAEIWRYPEFLPWCKGVRILERSDGRTTAELIVGYKMFRETFVSEVVLERPHAINVYYKSGPMSRLANIWEFHPVGQGACELTFHVDFDFSSTFLKAAMGLFFDKALTKMVIAFEGRAKELYGL